MPPRFRGSYTQKVDAKGRMSVPASFRRVIELCDPDWREGLRPNFVIVHGDHRRPVLECFSIETMNEIDLRIDAMDIGSVEREMAEEVFYGQSVMTQVDEDGRIVLPQRLREKLVLEGDALFAALGNRFEIWKPESHDALKGPQTRAFIDTQPDRIGSLSMLQLRRADP